MSTPTTHSEESGRVEKGPAGELKKTVSTKTPSVDGSTCRKDDDKIKFRGPDGGPKIYSKEELKKLQVHIEIKKPKAVNPSPNVPFDPNFIVPVRRPEVEDKSDGRRRRILTSVSEGKVPLFSRLPAVNDDDDGNAKKEKPLSKEKKKEKSEPEKSHSSRPSTKSRSRSPGSSSRRSDRRYKDYISEREEYIRRRKEAYLREREKFRRTHQRRSRHRSHSRSRSSSSTGGSSSDDRKSRSLSRGSSHSHSKTRPIQKHRRSRGSHRSRTRSRSRSRSRDYRRERSRDRNDPRHHGPGPSNMQGMIPYHGPPWVNRPPFRHPYMPGPPIPFYPAPMLYAAPPPFRPYPPAFRGAPRIPGRRP